MRLKAALLIMAIVLAFTAASFMLSISFTQRSMTQSIEHELKLALDIADSLVSTEIELLKSNAANIAVHLMQAGSIEEMTDIMASKLDEYTGFLSLTVLNHDGIIAHYGRSSCTWTGYGGNANFQRALSGEIDISTTHYDENHGHFIIHMFFPMSDDLVLSATIPAMAFSDLISGFKLWDTGSIFIVDDEATLIASVYSHLVYGRYNFIEEARVDPDMRDAGVVFQNMINTDFGSGRYHLKGRNA